MADFKYSANIDVNLNVKSAASQLKDLQRQLQQISSMDLNLKGTGISEEISEASKAALELQSHLKAATNISTGNLDFTKLNTSLKQSGISLEEYGKKLISIGPEGQKAFMNLSTAISKSEISMNKSSKILNTAFENLKKTIGWQLSSSIVNNFTGSIQRAVGYAQDLNKSLTDIRIVTGASTDQMATFAREANKAAKELSTTTTDYTKASLIYYQQGLSDAEVKARTETTIKMANATGTSAQTVSDQMTAIWNNYDNGTKSLTHYADVMTALGAATASSTDEIAEGLQKFASISDTVGLSYEYAASALATITSTSRESADVVGNSLKTLFSRIQGLQLGETLDDGTTLNKYSTAMAKVGISIKDSTGELKDMDIILDEMGSTWGTLANDEKMALAQTVAGVRQYTQLMTLMENWDQFKQNLNVANASEGTLDQQAAIYAESWEAASNRMRTAFEGLWDNLINSDGAIGLLDFFTGIISGIDGLVTSLGGASGTLLTFGGLFTKLFGDNIAKNIKEISNDIYKMTPFYEKTEQKNKENLLEQLSKAATEEFGTGSARSEIIQEQARKRLYEDAQRQKRYDGLTEAEKEVLKSKEAKVQAARDAQYKAAEKQDEGREKVANAVADNYDVMDLDAKYYQMSEEERKEKKELEEKVRTDEEESRLKELQDKESTKGQQLSNREGKEKKKLEQKTRTPEEEVRLKELQDKESKTRKQMIDAQIAENDAFITSVQEKIANRAGKTTSELIEELSSGLGEDTGKIFKEKLKQAVVGDELSDDAIESIARGMTQSALKQVTSGIEFSFDEDGHMTDEERKKRNKSYEEYAEGQSQYVEGKREVKQTGEAVKRAEEDFDKPLEHEGKLKGDWAEALVDGAEGLMSAAAAGESLSGLVNSFQEGTATFSSALIGITSTFASAANGFMGISSALSKIPGISSAAATGISLAATALLTLGATAIDIIDDITVNSKERIQNQIDSNNNLQSAADSTKKAAEIAKQQNEEYLDGIKKINSFDQNPETLAQDIFESNKKALNLINEYGLSSDQYTTDEKGLINIDSKVLDNAFVNKENLAQNSDIANILGQAMNNLVKAEEMDFKNQLNLTDEQIKASEDLTKAAIEVGLGNVENSKLLSEYLDGNWEQYKATVEGDAGIETEFDWKPLDEALKTYANLRPAEVQAADLQIDNAAAVVANKVLADNGITAETQEGYRAYSDFAANYIKNNYLDEWIKEEDLGKLEDTPEMRDERDEISRMLEEQGIAKGATITGYKDGKIAYQAEGSTETAYIERETVNAWHAAEQVANNAQTIIDKSSKAWEDATGKYTKSAAEAGFNIQQFGTAVGASTDSVQALYQQSQMRIHGASAEERDIISNSKSAWEALSGEEQKNIEEILSSNGIVDALGLTGKNIDIGSFGALMNSAKIAGDSDYSQIGNLFNTITETTGAESGEDLAKIVTALSSMDFTDNSYLNLMNLKSTLEAFGFSVNTGGLEALYAILVKLAGLGLGEDLADSAKDIADKRGALNKVTPGEAVDEATKNAATEAGLAEKDFVKDENGNYIYNGTQEDIDNAKRINNQAYIDNQAKIDEQQAAYKKATEAGLDIAGDIKWGSELARAVGLDYNSEDETYEGEGNQNLALLETALRLAEGSIKDTLNNGSQEEIKSLIDQINQFMENGSMTEDQQNQTQEDQLAKITNASDMMEGINQARESGDKSAFLDEDGLISDEAMARLESMPDKSDRLTSALNDLEAAKQAVKAADDGNDETQTEEESRAQAIYEEAEAETALQAAIDDAAKSRGINNDLLANTVEMMRTSGLVTQQAGESLKDYNKRLLESAIDYEENSQGLAELQKAYRDYTKAVKDGDQNAEAEAFTKMQKAISKITKLPLNKVTKEFVNQAKAAGTLQKALNGDVEAIAELEAMGRELSLFDKSTNLGQAVDDVFDGVPEKIQGFADRLNKAMSTMNIGESFAAANAQTNAEIEQVFNSMVQKAIAGGADMNTAVAAATAELGEQGIDVIPKPVPVNAEKTTHHMEEQYLIFSGGWGRLVVPLDPYQKTSTVTDTGEMMGYEFRKKGAGGKGRSPGGGGGGGGGGKKEPKKVANKRKSQTVKRYKRNDFRRDNIQSMQKSEEQKKDYLYGESKIAQMEKINKLAEKEARITADRMSESRKYLEEDRQNLIRYMRKYNLEAEFDSDGFLASYEREWTKLHEEIAALYEDNLLTEEEEKLEEEYNVKLEELEGALEDYENSLKELREDIEKYEESLYKMYDTKLEQFEHRLEFRLELNEDDMNYVDFLLEALGDNASKAVDRISLITQKSTALFDNIVRVKENIQAIYDLSDDPFQMWATGGLDIDGLLTEAQVEQLREHRDQLMDYMKELLEMRETIQEEVLNVFDAWTEKIDHNISAIDHYTGVLEHFKNVIDITGKDVFGMSDSFMRSMESAAIDQSMDSIEVNKAYYESLVQANAEAEQALQEARARGDAESEEHWEEVVRSTSESMQSAQDTLLSALENTLTMISDQFTAAMEDAVEQFNKSIYASGGLEGLSDDYSLLREQADLMAEDYDKIYNLTKLTRNINKTLDDTNIIAGKQRLTKLLQEVNDLQKSGVELSKYDLEYLEAKYNLYLAQIELENAQSNKDTVQLSRDSEGNWSYVYTTNEEKVNEAQQKYEDALYEMQNMNHEYMEEMSSSMIETASKMSEEIANLQISDFANLEEYNNKVQEIREKYEKSLNLQNEELNKVIDNNESLYETDWQNYSKYTGYKISADKDWIDSFRETTLGHLMGSESVQSDFNQTIIGLTDTLAQGLSDAAVQYFTQMNTALQTYGSSIDGFSGHIVSMTKTVKEQSDEAAKATESMGERMETAFKDVVTAVKEWQEIEAPKIEEELEAIKTLIEQINESIRTSAELTTDKDTSIIGSSKAIELINDSGLFGSWKINKNGTIEISDGAETETTNFVDYNAKLLEELDDAIELYANGKISDDALAEMFKRYWAYKDIINRIYDTTDTDAEKKLEEKEEELRKKLGGSIKFDTGGYTGEWGHEGKIAMLHEKELVLNANDTSNFLEALNISRQLIEMIEMNARASSLGLGEMVASTIKDTSQTIEQQVSITAEFPNATDHSEIEEAFDNLINIASQYAYRNE